MRQSLIIKKLYKVSIAFRKESFINAKKVLNFIQSLTNGKKVIESLTAFHKKLSTALIKFLQILAQLLQIIVLFIEIAYYALKRYSA